MKTYIKKNIKGYYIEFPEEIDAQYWAGQIGTTYEDFYDGKWVLLSDEQVLFHNTYPNASIKEVFEMKHSLENILADAISEKLTQVSVYDNSDSINKFYVNVNGNTISAWLTPVERSNYKSSIDAAELIGIDNLSLYIGETPITLPTVTAKLMLALILLYADQCFIVTKLHKTNIENLSSIEDVNNYDITQGYPGKLTFTVD